MPGKIRLDRKGIREVLNDTVAEHTRAVAEQVAQNLAIPDKYGIADDDIVVRRYRTDRTAYAIDVKHNAAKRAQIKDGILTRAAAQAGLEVKAR